MKLHLRSIFMKKTLCIAFLLMLLHSGCYKMKKMGIMKGKWHTYEIFINGGSLNQMGQILTDFDAKGSYVIYMLDDGAMKGEYYIGDELDYEVWGEWKLESTEYIYMNIDEFIDGTFLMRNNGEGKYTLYCEDNNVAFYGIGESTMVLELERE